MTEVPRWHEGDIVNLHILLGTEWIPLSSKSEADGPWKPGDFVNGHVFTGRDWMPAPPNAFKTYAASAPSWRARRWWQRARAASAPQATERANGSDPVARPRKERRDARRRAGRKPRPPRRQRARSAWVGFPPSSTMWDISSRCVMCGRPLTNPNSQRHRVGTDCIKRYGSQARKVPNPAYAEWCGRKARADADRIERQVTLDAEFARKSAEFQQAIATWRAIRAGTLASPP